MAISEEQVKHVAKLAKLAFADEELASFTDQLGKIIDMVEMLEEVDTEGVPFTSNVVETVNVMRQDRAQAGWNRDELLKNVPETEDGFIKVPAIIDNGRLAHNDKNTQSFSRRTASYACIERNHCTRFDKSNI